MPTKARAWMSWSSGKDSAWMMHVLRARGDVEVDLLPRIADGSGCVGDRLRGRAGTKRDRAEVDVRRLVQRAPRVGIGGRPKSERREPRGMPAGDRIGAQRNRILHGGSVRS